MGMPRTVPCVRQRGEFLAGQLLVDFLNLGWEAIHAGFAVADVTRDLLVGFQRRADRFDLRLGLFRRLVGHQRTDLFTQLFEKCLLIIQH